MARALVTGSRKRQVRRARKLEFRCRACGYGVVVSATPPATCPMCQSTAWTATEAARREEQ